MQKHTFDGLDRGQDDPGDNGVARRCGKRASVRVETGTRVDQLACLHGCIRARFTSLAHLCVHVCHSMCAFACVCISVRKCACLCVRSVKSQKTCIKFAGADIRVCVRCTCIQIHTYAYIYVYVNAHIYIYIYIHVHTPTQALAQTGKLSKPELSWPS